MREEHYIKIVIEREKAIEIPASRFRVLAVELEDGVEHSIEMKTGIERMVLYRKPTSRMYQSGIVINDVEIMSLKDPSFVINREIEGKIHDVVSKVIFDR